MKKCDICQKQDAVVKVRRVEQDGTASEIEVCADCARARGFSGPEKVKMDVSQMLAEVKAGKVAADERKMTCARCGLTFVQFKRTGRLGCAACYDSFKDKLEPLVRRLHNAVQHVGKAPAAGRAEARKRLNARRLSAELARAIEQEDYERAAAIRDQLKKAGTDAQG